MQPSPPSRAKELFDQIKGSGNPAEFLKKKTENGELADEEEFVDYKTGWNLEIKGKELETEWAKNLSGFANSDGGLLIFGIDAPDRKALRIAAVEDVNALEDYLVKSRSRATEPPVRGVEVLKCPMGTDSKEGFVVCYIPSSPWRPHQASMGNCSFRTYLRVGDKCEPCRTSVLRLLFAPQSVANIEMYYRYKLTDATRGGERIQLLQANASLVNRGPATAADVFVLVKPVQWMLDNIVWHHKLWEFLPQGATHQSAVATRSIHPSQEFGLFTLHLGDANKFRTCELTAIVAEISISAQDQAPIQLLVEVDKHSGLRDETIKARPAERDETT